MKKGSQVKQNVFALPNKEKPEGRDINKLGFCFILTNRCSMLDAGQRYRLQRGGNKASFKIKSPKTSIQHLTS